jgi:raffinose/stachyose/melibiose transport system permease protein
MTTTVATGTEQPVDTTTRTNTRRYTILRWNWAAGTLGWLWLLVVMLPIYWIVITSFKSQDTYFSQNPLAPPATWTMANYQLVIQNDFARYFLNSVIAAIIVLLGLALALLLRRLGGSGSESQMEGA